MKKSFVIILFAFIFLGTVSATTLFSDGFESGTLNGWVLTVNNNSTTDYWTANVTDPFIGNWHAQSRPTDNSPQPASVMEKNAGTESYSNITFSYYRKLVGLDASDEFRTRWFNGTTWFILENSPEKSINDMNYSFRSYSLPASANNNPNLKIRFECSASISNEYCRVDNVLVAGQPIKNLAGNYAGSFEHIPNNWYSVFINQTQNTLTFKGLNDSNQYDLFVVPFNSQGFSKRINYVWFNGWFNSSNLYISQYVGTGAQYYGSAFQAYSGFYIGQVLLPNSVYVGITSPILVNVTADFNYNKNTFDPVAYPGMQNLAYIDSIWNSSGHAYGPVLYQAQILPSGVNGSVEVSEWVKEDLASNGINPTWNVPLTAV